MSSSLPTSPLSRAVSRSASASSSARVSSSWAPLNRCRLCRVSSTVDSGVFRSCETAASRSALSRSLVVCTRFSRA